MENSTQTFNTVLYDPHMMDDYWEMTKRTWLEMLSDPQHLFRFSVIIIGWILIIAGCFMIAHDMMEERLNLPGLIKKGSLIVIGTILFVLRNKILGL